MLWILPCLQERSISAYPTSILRGTCPFTRKTTRSDPKSILIHGIICEMLNFLDRNLVHPAISQVIFVGELEPIRPDRHIKLCAPTIPDMHICTLPIRVRETIEHRLLVDRQSEQIKMSVLPSHHDLKHFMESMETDRTWHDDF